MKVLVAEDDPVLRTLLETLLSDWGYEVQLAVDGNEAWRVLQGRDAPELVVLDWLMPGMDGIDICRELRSRPSSRYVYVLLLTSRDTKKDVVIGLESGVDDYLTKPFNSEELRARITAGKRIVNLQQHLLTVQEELRERATRDTLTSLWNRATIMDMFSNELDRSARTGQPLGMILADVDHFKRVNDTFGHHSGDASLRDIARRLSATVRSYDAVGRVGGDEFLILLPGCDTQAVAALSSRIQSVMSSTPVTLLQGVTSMALSMGAGSTSELPERDVDALFRIVDELVYEAKRAGRNRVSVGGTTPRRDAVMACTDDGRDYFILTPEVPRSAIAAPGQVRD